VCVHLKARGQQRLQPCGVHRKIEKEGVVPALVVHELDGKVARFGGGREVTLPG